MDVGFNGGTEKEEREGGRMYPLPYSYFLMEGDSRKRKWWYRRGKTEKGREGRGKENGTFLLQYPLFTHLFFFF